MSNLIVEVNNGINTVVQNTTPLFTDRQQGNTASSCLNCLARSVMFVKGAGVVNGCAGKAVTAASNLIGLGSTGSLVVSTVLSPLITAKVLTPAAQEAGNLLQKGVDHVLSKTPENAEDNNTVVNPRADRPVLALEAPQEGPNAVRAEPNTPSFGVVGNCAKAAALVLGSGPMCAAASQAIGATLGVVFAPQMAVMAGAVIAPIAVAQVMPYVASGAALVADRLADKVGNCASRAISYTANQAANCTGRAICYAANLTRGVVSSMYNKIFSRATQEAQEAPQEAQEIEMREIPAGI